MNLFGLGFVIIAFGVFIYMTFSVIIKVVKWIFEDD